MKMTIGIDEAIEQLTNAEAVIADDGNRALVYPSIDSDDECFMILSYFDSDGEDYDYEFFKEDNQYIEIVGNKMLLKEKNKETVEILLLEVIALNDRIFG